MKRKDTSKPDGDSDSSIGLLLISNPSIDLLIDLLMNVLIDLLLNLLIDV